MGRYLPIGRKSRELTGEFSGGGEGTRKKKGSTVLPGKLLRLDNSHRRTEMNVNSKPFEVHTLLMQIQLCC